MNDQMQEAGLGVEAEEDTDCYIRDEEEMSRMDALAGRIVLAVVVMAAIAAVFE